MTNLEKIKVEILSILEEYKQRFSTSEKDKENIKAPNIISANALYTTPSDIKSDMVYEMYEAMNKHIEIFGDEGKSEIIKHIKSCDLSFEKFLNAIL
jgi:hypothetical protein